MIEPNCDMPWEIYLDWLQDQGNEDLRQIDQHFLFVPGFPCYFPMNDNRGDGTHAGEGLLCSPTCYSGNGTLYGSRNSDPHVDSGDSEQFGSNGDCCFCYYGDGIF